MQIARSGSAPFKHAKFVIESNFIRVKGLIPRRSASKRGLGLRANTDRENLSQMLASGVVIKNGKMTFEEINNEFY